MKKIKKLLIVACAMTLTGCSSIKNTPTEERIIADISENYPSMTVEYVNDLEIMRSQLFEEDKEWIADIRISATDEYAEMSAETSVVYDYYDDKGWIINTEETSYPDFTVNSTLSEMSSDDINELLNIWGGEQTEYIDSSFDAASGIEYITYKKEGKESRNLNNVISGVLECNYYNTDNGWNVINDVVSEKQYSLSVDDVIGSYVFDFDPLVSSFNGRYVFDIKEISPDQKSIVISGSNQPLYESSLGDVIKTINGQKQVIMYQDKDYHAEFVEYAYNDKLDEMQVIYKLIDLEDSENNHKLIIGSSDISVCGGSFMKPDEYENMLEEWS